MTKMKNTNQSSKKPKKPVLRYISILPALITLMNGLFGFAAIVFATNKEFDKAGYMIFLAMVADMLDGQIARLSKTTTSFGAQLDSICDVISFGVAPAFIILKILDIKPDTFGQFDLAFETLLHRFSLLAAATYVSCAAIRLARFNVEHETDLSHNHFAGLPSPAAAGVVVSLVIFHQEALPKLAKYMPSLNAAVDNTIFYIFPFVLIIAALLMVSRINYSHVVNVYLKGQKPLAYLFIGVIAIFMLIWVRQIALLIAFWGFALSGIIKAIYHKISPKKAIIAHNQPAARADLNENTAEHL
jgi:CDP-diacylglycerol--serine O-phosphatidyltransferase